MSLFTELQSALAIRFNELAERRRKMYERIQNAFSDANNGIGPTEDRNGRLHAPCDGYAHFETGELYGKGQFIVMPDYDDEPPKGYDRFYSAPTTRFKCETACLKEMVTLFESYTLRVTTGRRWIENGKEHCYYSVSGYEPLIKVIDATALSYWAKQREHNRQFKGVAPKGKQTVKAIIQGVKQTKSVYGRQERINHKMIITFENGATAYGTMPKCLVDSGAKAGDQINLLATFEHADSDNTHSYFSRPSIVD
ncbi:hypothetical protein J4Z08_23130 [Citrobacter portucalensis]|uniref:hypothetical protein n=1 Tax=Citrobacter portucalensis TaxID=1639133 RepID=UPI003140978C